MPIYVVGKTATAMVVQRPFEDRIITCLTWNSDGSRIAIATMDWVDSKGEYVNHLVRVLNNAPGQIELSILFDDYLHIHHISWRNNDSELVVVNGFGDVKRFDALTGLLIGEWSANGGVSALDIHPSQSLLTLAISRTFPGTVIPTNEQYLEVYDVTTGSIQQRILLSSQAHKSAQWVAWSPDGNHLAITNSKGSLLIYLWNGTSLSLKREIAFATNLVGRTYGTWGSDSRQIAVSASDKSIPGIVIYNMETGAVIRQLDQSSRTFPLTWSAETNLIAAQTGFEGAAGWATRIWNSDTGQIVKDVCNQYLWALAWSQNGTLAIGHKVTYDEWLQNPEITGVEIQDLSSLPT